MGWRRQKWRGRRDGGKVLAPRQNTILSLRSKQRIKNKEKMEKVGLLMGFVFVNEGSNVRLTLRRQRDNDGEDQAGPRLKLKIWKVKRVSNFSKQPVEKMNTRTSNHQKIKLMLRIELCVRDVEVLGEDHEFHLTEQPKVDSWENGRKRENWLWSTDVIVSFGSEHPRRRGNRIWAAQSSSVIRN